MYVMFSAVVIYSTCVIDGAATSAFIYSFHEPVFLCINASYYLQLVIHPIFGSDLPLLAKLHGIWSVDSYENH